MMLMHLEMRREMHDILIDEQRERPDIVGIAVPGMPAGSPGMEYGDRVNLFNVAAFEARGGMKVFASYGR